MEILLVEDNPHDAELTIRALRRENLANSIYHVKDGAEALAFMFATGAYSDRTAEDLPKMVLLDLKLPKVGGLEVLKRFKADERIKMIPVIVLTSSKQERDIVDSYSLGVNSYIVKPVEFDKFHEAVKQVGLYWLLVNKSPR
ncbi:MAG TPA: response regulator [Gemmatimonadales bacterium]